MGGDLLADCGEENMGFLTPFRAVIDGVLLITAFKDKKMNDGATNTDRDKTP